MNADRDIIPIVEEDQGEGFMDPLDKHDMRKYEKAIREQAKHDLLGQLQKQADKLRRKEHEQKK